VVDQPTELLAPIKLEAPERRSLRERLAERPLPPAALEQAAPSWQSIMEDSDAPVSPPSEEVSQPDVGRISPPPTAGEGNDQHRSWDRDFASDQDQRPLPIWVQDYADGQDLAHDLDLDQAPDPVQVPSPVPEENRGHHRDPEEDQAHHWDPDLTPDQAVDQDRRPLPIWVQDFADSQAIDQDLDHVEAQDQDQDQDQDKGQGQGQDQSANQPASVLGSTLVMASGTLVSRLLGLVRVALLAAVIGGLSQAGNAFDVANNLPNFIYAILAGGVLNAVLVPQIVRAFADGRGAEYVYRLLTLGTVILAVLTLVLTLGAGVLVWAFTFTKQWPADQMALAITFAAWCIPQVFFYGIYTLWGQVLNARGSFGPVMWAPAINNLISIIGFGTFGVVFGKTETVTGWGSQKIVLLAGTATLGVILQAQVLLIPLGRLGLWPKWRFTFRGYGLTRVGQMTGWTTLALLVDQAAMWVAVLTATAAPHAAGNELVAGNMALTNALATYIIPHSLITVSLTTALFTRMSKAAQAYDLTAVRRDLSYGIRTTSVFSFFFTAVMVVLAEPIIRVIFAGSDAAVISAYAAVLVPLSLGLVPLGITLLVRRAFFALDDGRTVFFLQVPMSLVWVGFILLCRAWLDPAWWVIGIALGQTLSFLAGAVLRLVSLKFRLRGIDGRRLAWLHLRAAGAALLTAELGYLLIRALPLGELTASVSQALVALLVVGPVMMVAYLILLKVMRVKELTDFLSPVTAKLRRGR